MGHLGELVRAWFGDSKRPLACSSYPSPLPEILDKEKSMTYNSGKYALETLRETGAPSFMIESARAARRCEPSRGGVGKTYDARRPLERG